MKTQNMMLLLRAWDDEAKKMYYSSIEQFDDMLGFRFSHFDTDNPIYSRFTGWHDKNGKKIFEGDIVKFDNTAYGGSKGIAEVVWINDPSLLVNPGWGLFNNGCFNLDTFACSQVIGNIYENPELLKGY